MSLSIPGRVVVFDYGEVISRSPSPEDTARMLQVAGIAAELEPSFWERYWLHRPALDRGTASPTAYWATIGSELGIPWSAAQRHAIWVEDFRSWWSVEPVTVELIERLHAGGTRVALLSNAGFDFASGFRHSPMAEFFEAMFVSAELDGIKPDPAIFLEVADALGIAMEQMIFIDNRAENTDAAAHLGATVHHFTGADGLRGFLEGLDAGATAPG